jgi:2-amino-4-hydroxy-6-hydroxymethyldihydropteridine diphosphokinase
MRDVVYIALGSNVGDRSAAIARARQAIDALDATRIVAESMVEETTPVGPVKQGHFLNQMVAVETDLTPRELLSKLQEIESSEGRERTVRWGPRTLDLDIVKIEGREFSDDALQIPHPELPNRDFWLRELAQIKASLDD